MYKLPLSLSSVNVNPSTENQSNKDKDKLLRQMEEIDYRYKNSASEGLGLTKLEYDAKTDEELLQDAKSQLSQKHAQEKESIITAIENMYKELTEKKQNLDSELISGQQSIDNAYDVRKDSAEKDALKRGLARSSIITGAIEEFDKGRIADKLSIENRFNEQILQLDNVISGLENEKRNALSRYEISHAAEIEDKLRTLKNEREKKMEDVIKYNNTIQEKEVKYRNTETVEKEKANQELYKQEEKLALVKNYYDTLPKEVAIKEFTQDKELKAHLGSYYNYMLNYLINKK